MMRVSDDIIGFKLSVWGAVRKNIISDRFSTKTVLCAETAMSARRDSYVCAQRQLCLRAETAMSARRDSYVCAYLAISVQR